jgi:hypothetical protein
MRNHHGRYSPHNRHNATRFPAHRIQRLEEQPRPTESSTHTDYEAVRTAYNVGCDIFSVQIRPRAWNRYCFTRFHAAIIPFGCAPLQEVSQSQPNFSSDFVLV